jgi:hypothetical protein
LPRHLFVPTVDRVERVDQVLLVRFRPNCSVDDRLDVLRLALVFLLCRAVRVRECRREREGREDGREDSGEERRWKRAEAAVEGDDAFAREGLADLGVGSRDVRA